MPTVIFATGFVPATEGHGGNRRAFQILHDLESAVGKERVISVSFPQWQDSRPTSRLRDVLFKARRRLAYYVENPFKLFAFNSYSTRGYSDPAFLAYYEEIARQTQPTCCVIEHTTFGDLLRINSRLGIPTVSCVQNLEALHAASYTVGRQRVSAYSAAIDAANEFRILSHCAERLFISRVETALVNGLGLPSRYYPYLPVGTIKRQLEEIRDERANGKIDPNLFLLLGSVGNPPTRQSFSWFVTNAKNNGLAKGIRVIVAGGGTEGLLPPGSVVPGLELRGWLGQAELDQLLVRVNAVLAVQRSGFGALTRVAEMACAGVPVLLSRYAAYALNLPPGVEVVDDTWEAWSGKLVERSRRGGPGESTGEEYRAWEGVQPRPLSAVVARLGAV
jgi:glycosyltransferase involved in cell wall biosynthesis